MIENKWDLPHWLWIYSVVGYMKNAVKVKPIYIPKKTEVNHLRCRDMQLKHFFFEGCIYLPTCRKGLFVEISGMSLASLLWGNL